MRCFKQAILLCALFVGLFSINASAKGYGSISFFDKGDVAVWSFYGEFTGVSFESDRKVDLFVKHCNGKNKVYIYELGSRGFLCQSQYNDEQRTYRLELLQVPKKYLPLGVVTASLRKIPQQKWNISALNKDELNATRKIAKKHLKLKPKSSDCKEDWCDTIVSSAIGKFSKYEKKLKLENLELFIIPSEHSYEGGGLNLSSAVIAKQAGLYRYIGKFDGCLENQPVDIDGDNIPELMTVYCELDEATIFNYYKVYPKIKLLVSSGG